MKRLLLISVLSLFSCSVFGQNAFTIVHQAKNLKRLRAAVISREIFAPAQQAALAKATVDLRQPRFAKISHTNTRPNSLARFPQVHIKTEFVIPLLANPNSVYGGYNYLKTVAKLSRTQKTVEPAYVRMWHLINDTHTYHGAHHIVNKSTLKEIYSDMQQKALEKDLPFQIDLAEMQNNAPAIFHQLHGNPDFARLFHNTNYQLGLYYTGGVKMIIEDFFTRLEEISHRRNEPELRVPERVQKATLKEAELWSKTFYLRWK